MNCRRGDIVLVLFPDSNLRTAKRRPALVIQADQLAADLPQTIVAMITSNMLRAGRPSRVIVRIDSESGRRSGLLMDSVIMTDNLATVQHAEIDRVIGYLNSKSKQRIRSAPPPSGERDPMDTFASQEISTNGTTCNQ
jgi:mRNA interferase MazF